MMTNRKRMGSIATFFALVLAFGLFAAPGGRTTVSYWQHSSAARDTMMKTLADEFMKANPGMEIRMEFIPEADYSTKLVVALAAGAAPDVMQVQSGMVKRLASLGVIQALDDGVLTPEAVRREFMPSSVDALLYKGKYFGLPTDVQTIVLYWNKDLLRSAGFDAEKGPRSWDELLAWSKALTKKEGGKMLQSGWGENGYHPEVQAKVFQDGGKMVDGSGVYCFADDPKSVAAIKFFVDAYLVHGVYDTKFVSRWAGFRQGKVAFMLGHPAMLGNLKQTAPDLKLGIGLIPSSRGVATTAVTSWAYVSSTKADSAAATKWIEFLASRDVEKRWTLATGELPARKALLADPDLAKDPQLRILLSSLSESESGYLQMGTLNKIWVEGFERMILAGESVQATLKATQEKLNKEIAKDLK